MADKAGFLIKEGGKFKTWKKRWYSYLTIDELSTPRFVLKNNVIYYSKMQVSIHSYYNADPIT